MWKNLLRSRLVKTVAVIVVLAVAWQTYLSIRAPMHVDPALSERVAEGQPLRISVELNFPPERFHTLFLQSYGRVMSVHGNYVDLRDVRPESVNALARVYWVDWIESLKKADQ